MTKRVWERAKEKKPIEYKYADGKVLKNGKMIHHKKDSLARRAAFVEREWAKRNKFDIK
jgi:hypothetical protein